MFQFVCLAALLLVPACSHRAASLEEHGDRNKRIPSGNVPFPVEVVATGLEVPWSLVWTPDGRLLVAERPGRVRVIERGVLRPEPLLVIPDIEPSGESGLMGMALHPRFAENGWLYLAYAYRADARAVRIVRYREAAGSFTDRHTIIENIPAARYHA